MNRYDLRMILKEADETTSGAQPSTSASGGDKGKKPKKKMDPAKKKMAITAGAIGVCLLVTALKNFSQTGDMFKGDGRNEILHNLFDSLGKQMAGSSNKFVRTLGEVCGFEKMNTKNINEKSINMLNSAAKEGGAYYNKDFVDACNSIGNGKALENLNTKKRLAELLGKYM